MRLVRACKNRYRRVQPICHHHLAHLEVLIDTRDRNEICPHLFSCHFLAGEQDFRDLCDGTATMAYARFERLEQAEVQREFGTLAASAGRSLADQVALRSDLALLDFHPRSVPQLARLCSSE